MHSQCKHCKELCAQEFCCKGCEGAFRLIQDLHLNNYYHYSETIYKKPPLKVTAFANDMIYVDDIEEIHEQLRLTLFVQGLYCGSCVWLIENTLRQLGAENARINMASNRLTITWKGHKEQVYEYIQAIHRLGYKLTPVTHDVLPIVDEQKDLLKRLFVAGFASIAMMMNLWGVWAGLLDGSLGEYMRLVLHIVAAAIAVPAVIYSARPFLQSGYRALLQKRTNMDVAISMAIIITIVMSIYQTTINYHDVYFDAATTLVFFLLISRFLDSKIRYHAMGRIHDLLLAQCPSALLMRAGGYHLVSVKKLVANDIVLVSAGEKIPVDGIVETGSSQVDNSIITGESMPQDVNVGAEVFCGATNLLQPIHIKVLKANNNTVLAEIVRLLDNATQSKSKLVSLADKIASMYTYIIFTIAACTFIYWWQILSVMTALMYAVSVLIITCPCAMGLAVPAVNIIASYKLLQIGVLLKSPNALEKVSAVKHIVFDKTGTLTKGELQVVSSIPEEWQNIIASMAVHSKHPICQALVRRYVGDIRLFVEEKMGLGLETIYNGHLLKLGSAEFCNVTPMVSNDIVIYFTDGVTTIPIMLRDVLKDDAVNTIKQLRDYQIHLLSGDQPIVVQKIAAELGISSYYAAMNPVAKYSWLSSVPEPVLMLGDGLNDAASLKLAHVSVSFTKANYIAQTASDFIIQGESLSPLLDIIRIASKAHRLMLQNFIISIIYNILVIPLAVSGSVNALIAAVCMSLSSAVVVLNSLRL